MEHFLTCGHFDLAPPPEYLIVRRAIEGDVVAELLRKHADGGREHLFRFGTHRGWSRDRAMCVVVPMYAIDGLVVSAVRFAIELHDRTGCAVADVEHGRLFTRAALVALVERWERAPTK